MSAEARSLLQAAVHIEYCASRASAGSSACTAAPPATATAASAPTCEWRAPPSPAVASLLRSLSSPPASSASAPSASDPTCLPANLDALLAPYLTLTAPDACERSPAVEACTAQIQCIYEVHFDHGDCLVDATFLPKRLAADPGVALTAPVPKAALAAHHRCNPEMVWLEAHDPRPARLTREQCAAAGTFALEPASLAQLGAAAGVQGAWASMFDVAAAFPEASPAAASPAAAVEAQPSPSSEAASPAAAGAGAGPATAPTEQSTDTGDLLATPLAVSAAACQPSPTSSNLCLPSLSGFAAAAAGAVEALSHEAVEALHEESSDTGRTLLRAAADVMRCAANTTGGAAGGASPEALQACAAAAAAAHPGATAALSDAFGPQCSRLSSAQCPTRPGCFLEAHGDHFDCARNANYAAMALLHADAHAALPAAGTSAAKGTTPLHQAAAAVMAFQRLADTCRASLTTCAAQRSAVTLTRGSLDSLVELAAEEEAGHDDHGDHDEHEHDHAGEGKDDNHTKDEHDDHAHDDHAHEEGGDSRDSQPLRIAGVFIVLVAGLVGCAVPLLCRGWLRRHPLLHAGLGAVSGGIMLSLALVHVSTHAVTEMSGLIEGEEEDAHDHRRRLLAAEDALYTASYRGMGRLLLQEGDYDEAGHDDHGGGSHGHAYPIGMVCVIFGFLLMAAIERINHVLLRKAVAEAAARCAADAACDEECSDDGIKQQQQHQQQLEVKQLEVKEGKEYAAPSLKLQVAAERDGSSSPKADPGCGAVCGEGDVAVDVGTLTHASLTLEAAAPLAAAAAAAHPAAAKAAPDHRDHEAQPHVPACCNSHAALVAATNAGKAGAQQPGGGRGDEAGQVSEAPRIAGMAFMFELGCVMHSFLIGLMLGTAIDYTEAATLVIALSFHQLFEGLSLASVLVSSGVHGWRFWLMALLYAVTCPAGIGTGIGIASTYDSHTVTARAVQGTINGVSGGLLLYLAAALIMGEFSGGGVGAARWKAWEHALLFALICVGAGGFAVLAIWA